MRFPADGRQTVAEVARIAVLPGSVVERAEALLAPLHQLMHYDAAWIALLDPERRVHPPLVRHGYPARVQHYLDGSAFTDDLEMVGMNRQRPPMRVKDLPVPPAEMPVWADYLQPAGFGEAIAVPLTTPDGRYLGMFGADTETSTPVSDAARDLLGVLAPLIAHAVDPLRSLGTVAAVVADAVAAVVLTRAGNTVALPGLAGHRLLTAGSPVLSAVRTQLADGQVHAAFLCPPDDADTDVLSAARCLYRVTALACPPGTVGYAGEVVLLSPCPQLNGLTRRELEVLGLLVKGWSNAHIAATLVVTGRTVASHVEHIMVKLGATSRTMAAARALGRGLFIPPELAIHRQHVDPPAQRSVRIRSASSI